MWTVLWVAVKDAAQLLDHHTAPVHTISMEQYTHILFGSFAFGCTKDPDTAGGRPTPRGEAI